MRVNFILLTFSFVFLLSSFALADSHSDEFVSDVVSEYLDGGADESSFPDFLIYSEEDGYSDILVRAPFSNF